MGRFKAFQIYCNFRGPLGDFTGTGDQPSGKVVLRKGTCEVLDTLRGHSVENQSKQRRANRKVLFGQSGIVKIHITLKERSVKLDKRIPTVLRIRFYLSRAWKQILRFSLEGFSTQRASGIFRLKWGAR